MQKVCYEHACWQASHINVLCNSNRKADPPTAAQKYMSGLCPVSFELQRWHLFTILLYSPSIGPAMPQTTQGSDLLEPVAMQLCRRCSRSWSNKACGLKRYLQS